MNINSNMRSNIHMESNQRTSLLHVAEQKDWQKVEEMINEDANVNELDVVSKLLATGRG
jgi:hypothetical protein